MGARQQGSCWWRLGLRRKWAEERQRTTAAAAATVGRALAAMHGLTRCNASGCS